MKRDVTVWQCDRCGEKAEVTYGCDTHPYRWATVTFERPNHDTIFSHLCQTCADPVEAAISVPF